MFAKPYKLKSNNTLKNSEKKHLCQRIQYGLAGATEDKAKELVPNKSNTSCMKLTTHSGETIGVYVVDGTPMVLEVGERLLPTVCALWKFPDLVPTIVVHSPVLSKLQSGAPLYLPGVAIPAAGVGFPSFPTGAVVAVVTQDNAAAAAVGFAVFNSAEMLMKSSGVCWEAVHTVADLLCKDPKFTKIVRPKHGVASYGDASAAITTDFNQLNIAKSVAPPREEWPSLGSVDKSPPAPAPPAVPNQPQIITEPLDSGVMDVDLPDDTIQEDDSDIPSDMDGLLRYCLLSFLKLEGKQTTLPLKTNLLYRNHMQRLCPPPHSLDVKKSSYKKMGKFLDSMQKEGLIEVREIEKGVDALTAVSLAHPAVRSHCPPALPHGTGGTGTGGTGGGTDIDDIQYTPPQVTEYYCVTAAVGELFCNYKKGSQLLPAEVRGVVTEYVKSKNLNTSKAQVTLDDTLAKIVGKGAQTQAKWDEVMAGVTKRMTECTQLTFSDGTVKTVKTQMEPIKMQVANRSGNKKVTLVSNLEQFGFQLSALSALCQRRAAAAAAVTRTPGAARDQLLLQGDQTYFVAKLLVETFGIPKKYVEGADKAMKKKK